MMVKAYKKLTDDNFDNVSVEMGMNAAIKLHDMTRKDAGLAEAAKAMNEMNRIINAVKEVVPEQYFNQILAVLDAGDAGGYVEAERVTEFEEEDEEDEFDPSIPDDEDDDEGDW